MTTPYWKWTLATGTLLAITPVYLLASEPAPLAADGAAAVQSAAPVQQLPPPTPVAPSVFSPVLPPAPPPGRGLVTGLGAGPDNGCAPAPDGVAVGRPASFWLRCKLHMQDCFLGYPEYFQAPPLGHSIALHYQTNVANADAARMVLYQYDFLPGGEQLSLRGRDRLAQIATMLPCNGFPIIIERIPTNPRLAEGRRLAVLNELAQAPFPVPAERVLIGPPIAVGLAGTEAVLVYGNLITQTAGRGPSVTGVGGAASGIAGQAAGGAGASLGGGGR